MTSSSSLDFYRAPNSQWIIGPFSSGDLDYPEDMGVERWMTVHLHCLWLAVELLLYHIWSIELTMFCCLLHQSLSSWYFWGIGSKPVRFRTPSFGRKRFEGSHRSARAAGEKGLSRFRAPNSHLPHTVSWIHTSIMDPLGLPAISRCPYFFDRVSFVKCLHATWPDLLQLEMPEKINPIGQSQKHQGLIYPLVMRDSPFGMIGNLTSQIFFDLCQQSASGLLMLTCHLAISSRTEELEGRAT